MCSVYKEQWRKFMEFISNIRHTVISASSVTLTQKNGKVSFRSCDYKKQDSKQQPKKYFFCSTNLAEI